MSILDNNISLISKYNCNLAKKIKGHAINEKVKIELKEADSNDVNLIYNNIPFHNCTNPQQEASMVINNVQNLSSKSITIILGLGLGYLFRRTHINSQGRIIVYEPNLDILRLTLELVDFSVELSDKRVFIANSKTELIKLLSETYAHKDILNFITLNSSKELYNNELEYFKNNFSEIQTHLESNFACLFNNAQLWLEEGIKNIPEFINSYEISALKDKLHNKPAIIVAPGPSLDKNLDIIKQYQDKTMIFCVSTAYKTLYKNNIIPDFVVFIDAQDCNKVVNNLPLDNTNIILQSITNNNTYKIPSENKFVFFSNNDLLSRWLSEKTNLSIKDYETKGTVSYCAMYSAFIAGCNPLILIGQDLAYTDGQCYSSSTAYGDMLKCIFDESEQKFKFEICNLEKFAFYWGFNDIEEFKKNKDYCLSAMPFQIVSTKGQDGEILPTELNYSAFIKYFEEFAQEECNNQVELINSSTGGAQIDGFKNIPLKDVLEHLENLNKNTNNYLKETLKEYQNPLKNNRETIKDSLTEMLNDILQFKTKAINGKNTATQLLLELKKKNLNIKKIKNLTKLLPQYYLEFKDNLFNKHQLLINTVFKELTDLTMVFDGENSYTDALQEINDVANTSLIFYRKYIFNINKTETLILNTINKLEIE